VSKESRAFGHSVAAAVEARIREMIARISERPEAAARIIERPGMYVAHSFVIRTKSTESWKTGSGCCTSGTRLVDLGQETDEDRMKTISKSR
jgi:hypothetical protein